MENEMAPVILTDLDDTLFQTMPKCPPGATDLRQMSSLMDGSASGFATKLQQNFLAWHEAGLVVPVTARGRDVLARVTIPSSDRKSVVEGRSVSVRVELGGRGIIKKKNTTTNKKDSQDKKA